MFVHMCVYVYMCPTFNVPISYETDFQLLTLYMINSTSIPTQYLSPPQTHTSIYIYINKDEEQ